MEPFLNLASQLEKHFPAGKLSLLHTISEAAAGQGYNLYLVGGAVRDLLLGRVDLDLDLVVEGDALKLASQVAQQGGGEVVSHSRFGTAKLRCRGLILDLVTARAETYSRPGALPTVRPGSIQDDLFRRDFTINTMAIHLDPARYGELVDPYGGEKDLGNRLLRILHEKSFIDDATRILRALRYEQRLDFVLEATTEKLLRRDTAMLETISGDRLRQELMLILKEESPEGILRRAEELGVLLYIHPSLRGDGWLEEKFAQARRLSKDTPSPALYLSLWVYPLSPEEGEDLIRCLRMPSVLARLVRDTLCLKEVISALAASGLAPSAIYRLLQGYSSQAILAVAIASDSDSVCQRLQLYLNKLRYLRPCLDGKALQKMGIPPGPQMGEILRALQEARLDQEVGTREEEEELALRWLSQQSNKFQEE